VLVLQLIFIALAIFVPAFYGKDKTILLG